MQHPTKHILALYILNRLALAVIAIIRFHAQNAVIAAFGPLLVPKAELFTAAYRQVGVLRAEQAAAVRLCAQQAAALYGATMAWFGRVVVDLPDFDPRGFGSRPEVVLDVLTDARRLAQAVEALAPAPSYARALFDDLSPLLAALEAAHDKSQNLRRELQALRAHTRELASDLHHHLIPFRRSVIQELGPQHVDSQRLRAERGRPEPDEEETETEQPVAAAPVHPEPSAAATANNGRSVPPSPGS